VLVLETVGRIDELVRAVRGLPGLEWLTEWDEDEIQPEPGVFYDLRKPNDPLGGRLYLMMSNQTGLRQFLSLWNTFRSNPDDPGFERGRGRWRRIFEQLKEIRTWGPEDRIYETGLLEDWRQRAAAGEQSVRVEVELWFREQAQRRQRSSASVQTIIDDVGGAVLSESIIPEIGYHALLVELPITEVGALVEGEDARLVVVDHVMFFRPVGQSVIPAPEGDFSIEQGEVGEARPPEGEPVLALFDGLPLENHNWLRQRLRIDDPDGWAANYEAGRRYHGTSMASLIVHGDLESPGEPLRRPLYVRPVMQPDRRDWLHEKAECIPENVLPVDLFHRAVRRMIEGEGDEPPTAPDVRVINVSIGDPLRQFSLTPSPWARLLDYLSWRYRLLFIVSAGNHPTDIELSVPRGEYGQILFDPERLQSEVLKAIAANAWNRRLLAPAEAINVLTVGAEHRDLSNIPAYPVRANPLTTQGISSPISAMGFGFRRATKPDLLFPGGRQLYKERLGNAHPNCTLIADRTANAPGQRVASPGQRPGELSSTVYTRGTSNATALATRAAGLLHDALEELRGEEGGEQLDDSYTAVALKTLLVHSARWGDATAALRTALQTTEKSEVARFLGYGCADPSRVFDCTRFRGTLIGVNTISEGEGHRFEVPLPPSLSGRAEWRRLTVTLGWLTPLNNQHRAYRRAALWFTPYGSDKHDGGVAELLSVQRSESDWQMAKRGTVQHEIFEGDRASAYVDGDALTILVSCAEEAGKLEYGIPYALAVTLEVSPEVGVPIYDEIRARIRARVAVRAR
jgi:hypothetical protein